MCSSTESLKLFSDHSANWGGRSKDKSHILSSGTPIKSDSQHQPLPLCFPQAIWLPDKICTNNNPINQDTAGGKGLFSPPFPSPIQTFQWRYFMYFILWKSQGKYWSGLCFHTAASVPVHPCRRSSHKMQRYTGIERSQSNQQERSPA